MSVQATLNKYYRDVIFMYPNNLIVGVFLFGSQNYNLSHENSDIDALAIICPSWDNVIYAEKPISTTINTKEGSIQVKDVRLVLRDMVKPTVFSIECLFTDYKVINPMFNNLWNKIDSNKELIAFANIDNLVNSLLGMAHQLYRDFKEYYNRGEKINARKKAARLVFVESFLVQYLGTSSAKDCFLCNEDAREDYFDLRNNDDDILAKVASHLECIEWLVKTMDKHEVNPKAASELDLIKRHMVKFALGENEYGKI